MHRLSGQPFMPGFFTRLGVTFAELEAVVEARPSLRGILIGYMAEKKLVEQYFNDHSPEQPDDHDRENKGDRTILYKGVKVRVEVKSLQTNSVKALPDDNWTGRFQCDASDSGVKMLPNGESLKTVCLIVGGFDLLAINLFAFGEKWRFAFAHNFDLPRTSYAKYDPKHWPHLLQTTPAITWPLKPPYYAEPWALLDRIARERASKTQ